MSLPARVVVHADADLVLDIGDGEVDRRADLAEFGLRRLALVLHRLRGGLERGLVLRRLFRFFVIFRDQDVDFSLQRLAARLLLIDLRARDAELTGADAEAALEAAGIISNKNGVPNDPRPPKVTSGIRLGTAALTTRGLRENDMRSVAGFIDRAMDARADQARLAALRAEVGRFAVKFPMPH